MDAMAIEQFNWQDASETSIWKGLLPELLTFVSREAMEEISDASDGFTRVAVDVKINGVPVRAHEFFERFEKQLEAMIESRAQKLLESKGELAELTRLLEDFSEGFRERIYVAAAQAGFELPERY